MLSQNDWCRAVNGKLTEHGLEIARKATGAVEGAAEWAAGVAREALSDGIARSIGVSSVPRALKAGHPANVLAEIADAKLQHTELFASLLADPKRQVARAAELFEKSEIHVPQRGFAIRPLNEPIGTDGLLTCAALLVVDKPNRLHYLAHLDGSAEIAGIRESLRGFDLGKTQNYMMLGQYESNVPIHTFSAIANNSSAVKNLRFIKWDGDGINQANVASVEGRLYRYFGGYSLGMMT